MSASAAVYEMDNTGVLEWPHIEVHVFEPLTSSDKCRSLVYLLLKRAIDLPLALTVVLLLSPLMLLLAVFVKLSSPGPVFFRQKRLGRGGVMFDCFKFRSMRPDAEAVLKRDPEIYAKYLANGYKLPEGEDPRITRIGRILRSTSLDELPQLLNVVRGDMSLVGPRPIVPAELKEYGERSDDFLAALPGITGKWQVSGRSNLGYPERADVELDYVYGWSFLEDLRILFRTVPVVLTRAGAH
jgi:lipopolysaccharide/colanic/teichoic acid biosynthesis glycosyltransferase